MTDDPEKRAEALAALKALKQEGTPFLLRLSQEVQGAAPLRDVLDAINPPLIHRYDVPKLLPLLKKGRGDANRLLALSYLAKRRESSKFASEIQARVADLLETSSVAYQVKAKELLAGIEGAGD